MRYMRFATKKHPLFTISRQIVDYGLPQTLPCRACSTSASFQDAAREFSNPLLFGLPVVATTAIAKDKFLVGDFRRAANLYDREQANVALSTEDGDNFVRNMVTIRAEERLGLAVKNPTALSFGDFGNIA